MSIKWVRWEPTILPFKRQLIGNDQRLGDSPRRMCCDSKMSGYLANGLDTIRLSVSPLELCENHFFWSWTTSSPTYHREVYHKNRAQNRNKIVRCYCWIFLYFIPMRTPQTLRQHCNFWPSRDLVREIQKRRTNKGNLAMEIQRLTRRVEISLFSAQIKLISERLS